jgi:predicted aldo/keto reductase-like oxidoreductase
VVLVGGYVFGLLLAYVFGGQLLHDLVEGKQRTLLPLWKMYLPLLILLLSAAATVIRLKRPVCDGCGTASPSWLFSALSPKAAAPQKATTRRTALRVLGGSLAGAGATAAGLGAAVFRNREWLPVADEFFRSEVEKISPNPRAEWKDARVQNYRRLGRTNVMVSDISLGSGRINDVSVARAALDRGINYFDTSPDYADTNSERVLGEAMQGHRDQIFLATKFCRADGHLLNETPVPEIMRAVEQSLKRLQTDHVDLIHIHACDRLDRLMAPNIHEAFDRLKEQGKVRFLGVSTHTPNLDEVANAAIDSGRFDVMMLAYHFGMWPNFGHILEKAKQNDVGIVAMKTLKGAKHTNLANFRDEASAYSQAAFRWVLSNPAVSCLVISIWEQRQVDEYLYASGKKPAGSEIALLRRYDELTRGDYCQPHCGACLDSCPEGLPINDVLRHRMYFKDYGWEKEGMQRYAALKSNAAACVACPAPCSGACSIGVPIREKMIDAHRVLTFPA